MEHPITNNGHKKDVVHPSPAIKCPHFSPIAVIQVYANSYAVTEDQNLRRRAKKKKRKSVSVGGKCSGKRPVSMNFSLGVPFDAPTRLPAAKQSFFAAAPLSCETVHQFLPQGQHVVKRRCCGFIGWIGSS